MWPFNTRFFSWAGGVVLVWEGVLAIWKAIKWLLGWGGSIDFVVERTQDPKWVGAMLNLLVHPPAWAHIIIVILAVAVIIWDQRRARTIHSSGGGSLRVKMKDGAPFLISSKGVSSITDNGADDFTINFISRPISHLKRFKMEVQHYLILGAIGAVLICIALMGIFSLGNSKPTAQVAPSPSPSVKATATVQAVKNRAPFYSKADVERLLEASFEITNLLQQKAVPARESAQQFISIWYQLFLKQGEPAFRAALQAVRLQMEDVNNSAWAISNKYQHYNSEIAPILDGIAFAGSFFGASNKFAEAGQNLPQQIDAKTLTFMTPMRDEYEMNIGIFQQWISDTYDRNKTATERFRSVEYGEKQALPGLGSPLPTPASRGFVIAPSEGGRVEGITIEDSHIGGGLWVEGAGSVKGLTTKRNVIEPNIPKSDK
jgi:hypothetical protein